MGTRPRRGFLGWAVLGLAAAIAPACGSKAPVASSSRQSDLDWRATCAASVRRDVACGKASADVSAAREQACVRMEPCMRSIVRADALHDLMKCDAEAPCNVDCVESIGSRVTPSKEYVELERACFATRACLPTLTACAFLRDRPAVRTYSDALLARLRKCLDVSGCKDAAECLYDEVSKLDAQVRACNESK